MKLNNTCQDDFSSISSSPGQETLLHLSARLGFTQLATYLLDQPGSMEALHIQDKSGRLPEDIAREKGMKLLADMFSRLISYSVSQKDVLTQQTIFF